MPAIPVPPFWQLKVEADLLDMCNSEDARMNAAIMCWHTLWPQPVRLALAHPAVFGIVHVIVYVLICLRPHPAPIVAVIVVVDLDYLLVFYDADATLPYMPSNGVSFISVPS